MLLFSVEIGRFANPQLKSILESFNITYKIRLCKLNKKQVSYLPIL